MTTLSLSAKSVANIDPHPDRRITVDLEFTPAQLMEAAELMVAALTPTQRFELLAELEQTS